MLLSRLSRFAPLLGPALASLLLLALPIGCGDDVSLSGPGGVGG